MKIRNAARSQSIQLLILITLGIASCNPPTPIVPTMTPENTKINSLPDWLEIYFTHPGAPESENFEGGPDEPLAAAIDKARLSVDIAANNLTLGSIRDALLRAQRRGVMVRLVMESDNLGNVETGQILEAGIPVKADPPERVMLDNFVVIDRNEIWTGSMNFTSESAYMDNNNLLHIRSSAAAKAYLDEFNVMFDPTLQDLDGGTATPVPTFTFQNNGNLEIYFLPEDDISPRINHLITGATESIFTLAPEFFGPELDGAIASSGQGVKVAGVVDASMGEFGVPMPGEDLRADGNKNGAMHESVMIIDQKIVVIGSYNFTNEVNTAVEGPSPLQHSSNVIIFFNPEIAATFTREYRGIYFQAPEKWPSITEKTTVTPGETTPPPAP
jgi:phosphatidylserine/phosphatidylglycerophosphate/cardiolipin synthase-like enzyme